MNITVFNACQKKGATYNLKEIFLKSFRNKASITEFYLPKDCPNFCLGCLNCFNDDEKKCKDADYIQKIEKALLSADLLVFVSPTYVYHTTGSMKAMLDHLAYRWMPHRPAGEMFSKRAIIITQALGAGTKSCLKDIKDSLSWWGISYIKECRINLLSEAVWEKIPNKKKDKMKNKLDKIAKKLLKIDYTKPAHTSLITKCKFYIIRAMQKGIGKENEEYTDYKYWKRKGWIDKKRPWKK